MLIDRCGDDDKEEVAEKLAKCGMVVVQDETFYVEPSSPECLPSLISNAPTIARYSPATQSVTTAGLNVNCATSHWMIRAEPRKKQVPMCWYRLRTSNGRSILYERENEY